MTLPAPSPQAPLEEGDERAAGADARSLLSEAARRAEELSDAAALQAQLRPPPVLLAGYQLCADSIAARELGGDFYDWRPVAPGVLSLTIGDVMGTGAAAAMLMASARAALHALPYRRSPAAEVRELARVLEADLARSESFITLFHCHLDLARRRLRAPAGGLPAPGAAHRRGLRRGAGDAGGGGRALAVHRWDARAPPGAGDR